MNKLKSIKINAVFLAFVLIAGTFAAMSPSSFIIGANAQREAYNYGMEDRYDSYEEEYTDNNNMNQLNTPLTNQNTHQTTVTNPRIVAVPLSIKSNAIISILIIME